MARDRSELSCSIIGSFRRHYELVLEAAAAFEREGIAVRSPRRSTILQDGVPFVRLEVDDPDASDEEVQLIALHRILASDFVYVLVIDGYVGPTTSYEIGRVTERRVPIYYSERPTDLPIPIAPEAIADPATLAGRIGADPPQLGGDGRLARLHADLLAGALWSEPRLRGPGR